MFSEETIFATQENRFVALKTPLAENALLFKQMTGQEALGRLFEYEIDCLSENRPLDNPTALLGKDMTVSLTLNSGSKRHFHGFVSSIRHQSVQNNAYSYRVVLRPWLWFLTRSSHCRIFQHKSVPDILQAVLSDYQSLGTFKLNLGSFRLQVKNNYL
jgi:type VI secretion system secreted protein VgrG